MAGGVALNCVANGKIARSGLFDEVFVQPAAGDAGGSLGAAIYAWYHIHGKPRVVDGVNDAMHGGLLGPRFEPAQIKQYFDAHGYVYAEHAPEARDKLVAAHLAEGKVVGLFQGRMEFGPRALCNRSILGDARSTKMQSHLNLATKFRESFRPFAPVCLEEAAHRYFEQIHKSPYMLMVDQVRAERLTPSARPDGAARGDASKLYEWVNTPRSDVPAITHVDNSARIQTIDAGRNPRMHRILKEFEALTGEAILINTSFNVRSEPIVCTPEDAYACFMRSGMDTLVVEDFVLIKAEQPEWHEEGDWRDKFEAD
jgi:carbamoyltransferase